MEDLYVVMLPVCFYDPRTQWGDIKPDITCRFIRTLERRHYGDVFDLCFKYVLDTHSAFVGWHVPPPFLLALLFAK